MRALVLLLAAAVTGGTWAQVQYASGDRGRDRGRRLIQQDDRDQTFLDRFTVQPALLQATSSRGSQRSRTPSTTARPTTLPLYDDEEYQDFLYDFDDDDELAPTTTRRPQTSRTRGGSVLAASNRAGSRFRPPADADYRDSFELEGDSRSILGDTDDDDFDDEEEEEEDRLSLLLAESTFRCDPDLDGYYADDTVGCEVFHYCAAGVRHSWICPEGTIYHQINLICVPPGSDNICQRSTEFHFVNDYLYQQINNDSYRPQYADRYFPPNFHSGSDMSLVEARPTPLTPPRQVYDDTRDRDRDRDSVRRPVGERRRSRRPPLASSSLPEPARDFLADIAGFEQPQSASASVIQPTETRVNKPKEDFDPNAFQQRQRQTTFRPATFQSTTFRTTGPTEASRQDFDLDAFRRRQRERESESRQPARPAEDFDPDAFRRRQRERERAVTALLNSRPSSSFSPPSSDSIFPDRDPPPTTFRPAFRPDLRAQRAILQQQPERTAPVTRPQADPFPETPIRPSIHFLGAPRARVR